MDFFQSSLSLAVLEVARVKFFEFLYTICKNVGSFFSLKISSLFSGILEKPFH